MPPHPSDRVHADGGPARMQTARDGDERRYAEKALEHARKALEMDPCSAKALFRARAGGAALPHSFGFASPSPSPLPTLPHPPPPSPTLRGRLTLTLA